MKNKFQCDGKSEKSCSAKARYVTVQKARDPIASEKQIVFIRQLQNTVEVR